MALEIFKDANVMKISVIDNMSDIKLLRKYVEYWLEELNVDEFQVMAVKLCIHEAVNNSMVHAYKSGERNKKIAEVDIQIEDKDIHIEVKDFGDKEWYKNYQSLLADDDKAISSEDPRGRGLIIIKKLVDSMAVENMENQGTRVVLKIKRNNRDIF